MAAHSDVLDLRVLAKWVTKNAVSYPRVLVGIDGPGASGKSTLATQLAAAMGDAHIVHVDDFYLPELRRQERRTEVGPLFDLPRLTEQVIVPGRAGKALSYQRYDWTQDELADWIKIPRNAPIIIEGVFCLTRELRSAYTYRVWCRADPRLRLARGLARDGEAARSKWVNVWMPLEDEYAAIQEPEQTADLVVDSSAVSRSDRIFLIHPAK